MEDRIVHVDLTMEHLTTILNWETLTHAETGIEVRIGLSDRARKVVTPESQFWPAAHAFNASVASCVARKTSGLMEVVGVIVELDDFDAVPRGRTTKFWMRADEALDFARRLKQGAKAAKRSLSEEKCKE